MQFISQDSLFNPYLRPYPGENERAMKLTPHSMEYHVKSLPKSGLTQIEYCRVHRLSYSKLVYWLKKIRTQAKNAQVSAEHEPALCEAEEPQYSYEDIKAV